MQVACPSSKVISLVGALSSFLRGLSSCLALTHPLVSFRKLWPHGQFFLYIWGRRSGSLESGIE